MIWTPTELQLPKEGKVIETKIHDEKGERNVQWFFPDGSMYVYYTPTHWREKK